MERMFCVYKREDGTYFICEATNKGMVINEDDGKTGRWDHCWTEWEVCDGLSSLIDKLVLKVTS
jgi:hypothetical protein